METVEIEVKGEKKEYSVPSSFREMNGDQFRAATKMVADGKFTPLTLSKVTSIPISLLERLSAIQRHGIESIYDFVTHPTDEDLNFKDWKIGSLDVDGTEFFGPSSNFGNVTWGEFVFADQCMINGLYMPAVAAMFRPKRADYNGETDIRIPFTIYGTNSRFEKFNSLPGSDVVAVAVNYRAMRRASIEDAYPNIFHHYGGEQKEESEPDQQEQQGGGFSWTEVHRNVLGDRIEEEDKFLNLNVHTVLHRLNAIIEDNKKRR